MPATVLGMGGAMALISKNTGGTQYNFPVNSLSKSVGIGDDVMPLINNNAAPCVSVDGIMVGSFNIQMPLIPGLMKADFYNRALCYGLGDTDAINYHALAHWPDASGDAAIIYDICKFAGWSGEVNFGLSGLAASVRQTLSAMSIDPESTATLTSLGFVAPSSGPLSSGNAVGFGKTTYTGPSDVVRIAWGVNTGCSPTPGISTPTNTAYAAGAKGLIAYGQSGSVSITQHLKATTVVGFGAGGPLVSLVVTFGTAGSGNALQVTFTLRRQGKAQPSGLGPLFSTYSYALRSTSGTLPVTFADV